MSSHHNARDRILARLHASGAEQTTVPEAPLLQELSLDRDARIEHLAAMMTAMRTDVHIVDTDTWIDTFKELAREKGWKRLLYGPGAPIGPAIEMAWAADDSGLPELVAYTGPVETFKEDLFQIDAGLTSVRAGVADTGAVVLWPTPHEPRLMSLVPPVHVAVLDADTIYNSLAEIMSEEKWVGGMPTNALLISGPSKTADIEFTLVFGVHGPKELVLLIRK
ncbi:lactate utilization protein [uncultured Desulfosarcina sp.]|uniref:LutC/YkgG family protein n=1 Tax=uncultured Desulfosarcina sp. TaxID=218289 RepID=UPI0029C8170C|nr:lactate utilization protein [uncultured Desulfosarcina sp.]